MKFSRNFCVFTHALQRVTIGAVYQLGNDRNNTVRRVDVQRDITAGNMSTTVADAIITDVHTGGISAGPVTARIDIGVTNYQN